MTDHNELVNRYRQFRQITRKLHSTLPEYLSKRAFNECGKKLGIMRNGTLIFNGEQDMAVLMDYCIYDYRENAVNAVSRYLADSEIAADSDEYKVLKAMSESFYTLVQVEDVLPGVGVRVNDLLGEKQFLLIDIGFSNTAGRGVVIATRILPLEDFVMTSGAALPIDGQTLSEIFDFAVEHYGSEDGNYIDLDMQEKSDLTAMIIRLCLRSVANSQIFYEDVPEDTGIEPITAPLRGGPRIGRNEPCPCGSGKKYKRCCGP
ncbi:MAG: SEC-C domain-containing protein [Planctomycetes bacterium]|nr:SEC-C domain-containing protein [Planctomycetota bacterium]